MPTKNYFLTQRQRSSIVLWKRDDNELSNREIARRVKCTPKTVNRYRKMLSNSDELEWKEKLFTKQQMGRPKNRPNTENVDGKTQNEERTASDNSEKQRSKSEKILTERQWFDIIWLKQENKLTDEEIARKVGCRLHFVRDEWRKWCKRRDIFQEKLQKLQPQKGKNEERNPALLSSFSFSNNEGNSAEKEVTETEETPLRHPRPRQYQKMFNYEPRVLRKRKQMRKQTNNIHISADQIRNIVRMKQENGELSFTEIGRRVGCNHSAVSKYWRKYCERSSDEAWERKLAAKFWNQPSNPEEEDISGVDETEPTAANLSENPLPVEVKQELRVVVTEEGDGSFIPPTAFMGPEGDDVLTSDFFSIAPMEEMHQILETEASDESSGNDLEVHNLSFSKSPAVQQNPQTNGTSDGRILRKRKMNEVKNYYSPMKQRNNGSSQSTHESSSRIDEESERRQNLVDKNIALCGKTHQMQSTSLSEVIEATGAAGEKQSDTFRDPGPPLNGVAEGIPFPAVSKCADGNNTAPTTTSSSSSNSETLTKRLQEILGINLPPGEGDKQTNENQLIDAVLQLKQRAGEMERKAEKLEKQNSVLLGAITTIKEAIPRDLQPPSFPSETAAVIIISSNGNDKVEEEQQRDSHRQQLTTASTQLHNSSSSTNGMRAFLNSMWEAVVQSNELTLSDNNGLTSSADENN